MLSDMRVLQINAVYGYRSTGVIVRDIQECSREHGIEAFVAFPKGNGCPDSYSFVIGNKIDHKLHALISRIGGKQSYFSRFVTWGVLKKIKALKPDIVHLHNLHSNYININSSWYPTYVTINCLVFCSILCFWHKT